MNKFLPYFGSFIALIFLFQTVTAQSCSDGSYSYDDDIAPILNANCGGCHTTANPPQSGWNCSTYAGTLASGNNCGAGVTPGDISASSLYDKIKFVLNEGNPDCGSIMPPGGGLTVAQATAIQTWIVAGAQESCPVDEVLGCTDNTACNYDAAANTDDNSCLFEGDACDDGNAGTENDMISSNCICEGVVGIEEYSSLYISEVYPQPIKNRVNINFFSNQSGKVNVSIYAANGKEVYSYDSPSTMNVGEQTLSLLLSDNISTGLYLIKLSIDAQQIVQKVVFE